MLVVLLVDQFFLVGVVVFLVLVRRRIDRVAVIDAELNFLSAQLRCRLHFGDLLVLDQDLVLQLAGRGQGRIFAEITVEHVLGDQFLAEHFDEDLRHSRLLMQRTTILNGENHRVRRGEKGTLVDHFHHQFKGDFTNERSPVIDHRITVIPVPTVQFNASTAREKHLENELSHFLVLLDRARQTSRYISTDDSPRS